MSESLNLPDCPICRARKAYYAFTVAGARLVRCHECDFFCLNPQPSDATLAQIYNEAYFVYHDNDERMRSHSVELKTATAESYLDMLTQAGQTGKRLLEVGCGEGYLLRSAEKRGYDVTGVEYSEHSVEKARRGLERGRVIKGELSGEVLRGEMFDVCVLADVIEHVRDPRAFLKEVWDRLVPGGTLLVATPSRDSWSARLMKMRWLEFKLEHLSYFDRRSLQSLLWQTQFRSIECHPGRKILSLRYIGAHFERYPVPLWTQLFTLLRFAPTSWREQKFSVAGSGMISIAKKQLPTARRPLLSIIIPAYNEANTIDHVLRSVADKQISGVEKEVVIVESNSTDGTRELVQNYAERPGFRVILEDRPRGKGHATRAGLAAARGDIVLIQDADLEYDFEDYEALLEPIISGREAFVLGARHGGRSWKMRSFSGQPIQALIMNLAHWGFTFVINASLGVWLKDPFTMFKVFRRDCAHNLRFECNRFDFDWELLIKLIRKGYRPIEIPVNYRSRSFKEGKKIRMIRDPLTWARAWFKARFLPLR